MDQPQKGVSKGDRRSGLTTLTHSVVLAFFGIAGLYFGASVLVPLSMALLMFVLITAIVDRVSNLSIFGHKVPSWLAHFVAFGGVVVGLLLMLSVISNQASAVSAAFPHYEARFAQIVSRFAALVGDEAFEAVTQSLSELNLSGFASGALSSAGGFLSGLFLVILYIAFLMVERGPMRKKLQLALPKKADYERALGIADSMSTGLQRYMGIKTFVSLLTGAGCYLFMKPVGLDFAETWAVLAFALNFIPTIGSMLGVLFPAIVALVQFETVTPILIVVLGCGAVQFCVGNVLEPSLTGKTLNLSPFMVILSLTFWTAVWGVPGALLSVPITVCLMIVLVHIPATLPLAILMSGDGQVGEVASDAGDGGTQDAKEDAAV